MLDRTNLLHLVPVEEEDPHNPYDGKFINIYNNCQYVSRILTNESTDHTYHTESCSCSVVIRGPRLQARSCSDVSEVRQPGDGEGNFREHTHTLLTTLRNSLSLVVLPCLVEVRRVWHRSFSPPLMASKALLL